MSTCTLAGEPGTGDQPRLCRRREGHGDTTGSAATRAWFADCCRPTANLPQVDDHVAAPAPLLSCLITTPGCWPCCPDRGDGGRDLIDGANILAADGHGYTGIGEQPPAALL
jgi:hypothetical protein